MLKRLAAVALLLACQPAIASESSQRSSEGYWVVVGSVGTDDPRAAGADDRIEATMRECRLTPFGDFTSTFSGFRFRPGLKVYVIGAFPTRAAAEVVLLQAQKCVPDAYIKWSAHVGE